MTDLKLSQGWTLDSTGYWPGFTQTNLDDSSQNLAQARVSNPANEITGIT